ncbi:HDOD domain-containing protein [Bacillus sp. V3B]|uniref:EAL and HDOD domain-containing protein n=1 Tax=Bacillus sp. V3B TaxID=2804915 RepID=UPI00210BCA52|nr:HDOD domain-containing protein [Bacillus sp. V3B]MCQ6276600.1 HDOD domain-containing protein [Bacillus sp. V3B]
MEVFVARQPVFNIEEEIVGYELLYRNDLTNVCPYIDGDQATAEVIINSYLNIGLERLTKGKKCSIHFTENLLEQRLPTLFSPNDLVVKISEAELSYKLIEICKELKELGYTIILSECIFQQDNPCSSELLPYIDMIKVDFRKEFSHQHERIEQIAAGYDIKLLAEKIETYEAYEEAKNRGYQLFQGYFFSEPIIESTYEVPTVFSSYYQDIQNKSLEELDVDALTDVIERDLSFSVKLLKLINKSSIDVDRKICSIREAIAFLGVQEIQKWIYLLSVRDSLEKQSVLPDEIIRMTLTRAKLCETIATQAGMDYPDDYYMAGLISTMEKIVSQSMEETLEDLPLKDEIHDALMGKKNEFKEVLDLVEAVETAKWKEISDICNRLNISERELFRIYAESLYWTTEMIRAEKVATSEIDSFSSLLI